jgi:hypothetical protein
MTTAEYYGETRRDLEPVYHIGEDREGPLCLEAAVTRGNPRDPNNLSTMVVLGNVDMLSRELVQDLTKFETDPEKIRAIRRRIGDLAESGAFR